MSEFDGTPLVAGSVVGVRGFNVDPDGMLRGLFHSSIFEPGDNQAHHRGLSSMGRCGLEILRMHHAFRRINAMPAGGGEAGPLPAKCTTPGCKNCGNPAGEHRVAGLNCTCGFYAYFDEEPYGEVAALVEGSGVVTVGSRGFRAQKARLVALVDPFGQEESPHDRWDRWSDWHYRHDGWNSILTVPVPFAAMWLGAFGVAASIADALWWLVPLAVLVLGAGLATLIYSQRGWRHGLHRRYAIVHPELTCVEREPGIDAERFALVRRNYPDVPVYPSLKAARLAHPTSGVEAVA